MAFSIVFTTFTANLYHFISPGGVLCLVACVCSFVCYQDNRKTLNPLKCRDNYCATSNNTQWPLMGGAVTFGTARRGLGGAAARPGPSSLYQM